MFHFQLLRRICTSPLIYCFNENTCGSCDTPYTVQCSTGVYSTVTGDCVNATGSQRFHLSKYNNAQYMIVAQWVVGTPVVGYQQILTNSTANMINRTAQVGDILGFMSTGLGKEMTSDGTQDYRCVASSIINGAFACAAANLTTNSTTYRFFLQMTITKSTDISPQIMYMEAGNYNVAGTITQNNATSLSLSTVLPVVYGIDWIEVVGPPSINLNTMVSFVAHVYPASEYLLLIQYMSMSKNKFLTI